MYSMILFMENMKEINYQYMFCLWIYVCVLGYLEENNIY